MSRNLYIFDCFGVVISDVSTLFMNGRLNAEEQEYMRKHVFRSVDVGEITNEEMFDIISERYGMRREKVVKDWQSYECVLEETVELIRELKRNGQCVALLSNAWQGYIDYLFEKFELTDLFDKTFVSSNYGAAKPDEEFYRICVESFDEKFDKIYFTDDNPANLVELERFGITPILFISAKDFLKKVDIGENNPVFSNNVK